MANILNDNNIDKFSNNHNNIMSWWHNGLFGGPCGIIIIIISLIKVSRDFSLYFFYIHFPFINRRQRLIFLNSSTFTTVIYAFETQQKEEEEKEEEYEKEEYY